MNEEEGVLWAGIEEELEPAAPCYEMQQELQEAWETIAKTNKRLMLMLMEVVIQKKRAEFFLEMVAKEKERATFFEKELARCVAGKGRAE